MEVLEAEAQMTCVPVFQAYCPKGSLHMFSTEQGMNCSNFWSSPVPPQTRCRSSLWPWKCKRWLYISLGPLPLTIFCTDKITSLQFNPATAVRSIVPLNPRSKWACCWSMFIYVTLQSVALHKSHGYTMVHVQHHLHICSPSNTPLPASVLSNGYWGLMGEQ